MKHIMVSVRDVKSEIYGQPFFMVSVGAAIRSFDDAVNKNSDDNMLFHHAADFALFQIGVFDDNEGSVEAIVPPKVLIEGMQVKKHLAEVHKISKV